MLSRVGIKIPDGISPHTIYCKLRYEKRKAEQLGYNFNHVDFQQRINFEAQQKLPGVINRYYARRISALDGFSALYSRSAQEAVLQSMRRARW